MMLKKIIFYTFLGLVSLGSLEQASAGTQVISEKSEVKIEGQLVRWCYDRYGDRYRCHHHRYDPAPPYWGRPWDHPHRHHHCYNRDYYGRCR